MKKVIIVLSCIFAFTALALWLPDAEAYPGFDDPSWGQTCASCHPQIANFGAGHSAHAGSKACNDCHLGGTGYNNPPLANCAICHVAAGTRQHHRTAGAHTCAGCHTNPESGGTENTTPPGYAGTTLNNCNGSEELFASNTISLDNDGDGLTDAADPDCAPVVQWQAIAGYLNSYIQSQYVSTDDGERGFIQTPQEYKDTVDNDGGLPGDGTVCGVGDDMANRPVLVDNLMAQTTLIPGTSLRNSWNNASPAYGGMSTAVLDAVKAKVIAHREAGFSDDISVY